MEQQANQQEEGKKTTENLSEGVLIARLLAWMTKAKI